MISATSNEVGDATCWLICNHTTLRKYGLGYAKPSPVPVGPFVRNGYLTRGRTLDELAKKTGIDPGQLVMTVKQYDQDARNGNDPEFGRGTTAFNRYLGDQDHKPNPNVGPVGDGPYYALQIYMGDLGTFDGVRTAATGEVLDEKGLEIPGLFAVGNDRDSVMGGAYPGAGITLGPAMTFGYLTGRKLTGAL